MTRRRLRWLPAVVVPAVIAAGALGAAAQAGATASLPPRSPSQVLAMVGQSTVQSLSGEFEQTSELGLPQLPSGLSAHAGSASGMSVSSVLELITGSHTARVFLDGPTNARVQVLDQLAERDVVRHGTDVWLYSSETNTATHMTIPASTAAEAAPPAGSALTPAQLAQRLLSAIDPSTQVTVGSDTTVASRSAYDLVLTPRDSDTLVGSVSIAVDSETGLPLSVDILARGQAKPAFHVAFTSLTLAVPTPDLFAFTPPAGATVKEQALPEHPAMGSSTAPDPPRSGTGVQPIVTGTGWGAVVVLPAGTASAQVTGSPLLAQATQAVAGGRLLHTALVNVFLTDDGRVVAGSVPLERLQAAAAGQ